MRGWLALALAALLASCSSAPKEEALEPAPPAQPITPVAAQNLSASAIPASVSLPAASSFGRWTAVVVAGDNHAHSGKRAEIFDNARRDVAAAFVAAGFAKEHVRQFSVQPDPADPTAPAFTSADGIRGTVHRLLGEAGDGCLFYLTSHGDETGIMFNEDKLSPEGLKSLVDRTCGGRPSVIFVSACHSGVFVPALSAPNRMVMSASRPDRTSFGCGETNKYPYFDDCLLQSLPASPTFPALANGVKACVAGKEAAQKFLPSEPQITIGAQVEGLLQTMKFAGH
ncbi:MAG: C13 family peptidase [Alphaproteobacteria bacterium]